MSCNTITNALRRGCSGDLVGGIDTVYIASLPTIAGVSASLGLVTTIVMSGSGKFYEYQPNRKTSTWSEAYAGSVENGTLQYDQNVTLVFSKNDSTTRNQISILAEDDVLAIVKTYASAKEAAKYFLVGYSGFQSGVDFGMGLRAAPGFDGGTQMADGQKWTVNLTGQSSHPAYEITGSIIAGIITAAV